MSWYQKVTSYIDENMENFIAHFFPDSTPERMGDGFRLNPSPCCNHNDCFSISTKINAGNCFSCSMKGTKIGIVEEIWGKEIGHEELEDWSGIKRSNEAHREIPEDPKILHKKRMNEIYSKAVDFYNMQLYSDSKESIKALAKQTGTGLKYGDRAHTEESLRDFKIGLSLDNFDALIGVLKRSGYTPEEIKEARKLIWIPPFYFVYPFYNAEGELVRLGGKAFKRTCLGTPNQDGSYSKNCLHETYDVSKKEKQQHEESTGHRMSPDVFSTGKKSGAYFSLQERAVQKKLILVEGENDAISFHEALKAEDPSYLRMYKILAIGGNGEEGMFSDPYFRTFDAVYEAFDNDEAGKGYRDQLNKDGADLSVYHVEFDRDFKDIDEYLKANVASHRATTILDDAKAVESDHIKIEREGKKRHLWHAKNRRFMLSFEIESYNRNQGQLHGAMSVYKNGVLVDKKIGGIDTVRVDASMQPAKLQLSAFLADYYGSASWIKDKPERPLNELTDIVHFAKNPTAVYKQIAWYLHHANGPEYEKLFRVIDLAIADQKVTGEVLREVNGFTNSEVDVHGLFPKINLTQFFHVRNNDAFFYFTRVIQDGESTKLVPYLLTNKKEEIRLDLMKRKDKQSLLLIQNKYEVPYEVETAVMDQVEVSLQPFWVDKWQSGEIDEKETSPFQVIQEIEGFIRKCYYLEESTTKVLALWIYSTYYYMLFKSGFPYLMFTGPKGTGKSTLDMIVYLLSLNAKLALDMSESALYRSVTFEGGTFILDEVEHLADKKNVDVNGYAKILKGGYSEGAAVYRTNMDKGGATEKFSVFGPKVISNINGIDDVIADRCIYVRTFRVPEDKLRGLEDVQMYAEELRSDVHSITSRCVISALENFKEVSELFNGMDTLFETGSARLTQILKPLITIAKFVGGDYEEHLIKYYEYEVKGAKDDIAGSTVEGMIRNVITRVAEELLGVEEEKWALDPRLHVYATPINYSAHTGLFEIDTLHLKTFCEELNDGEEIPMKVINSTIKAILGPNFDEKKNRRQTSATIHDENLIRQMNGKKSFRVYRYYLTALDYVDEKKYAAYKTVNQEEPLLF